MTFLSYTLFALGLSSAFSPLLYYFTLILPELKSGDEKSVEKAKEKAEFLFSKESFHMAYMMSLTFFAGSIAAKLLAG